jgi:hypothetical protein
MHNKQHLTKKMRKKGWSEEELEHLNLTLAEHKKTHHVLHPAYDRFHQWIMILALIFVNIAGFLLLLPFYLLFIEWAYIITAIFAIALGFVLDGVIKTASHLEHHHHIFIALIIPMISIVSIFIITYFLRQNFGAVLTVSHITIALTYAIISSSPYYVRMIVEKIIK